MKNLIKIVSLLLAVLFIMASCNSNDYEQAKKYLADGEYSSAIEILEILSKNDYQDSKELLKEAKNGLKYENANKELENGEYTKAIKMFEELSRDDYSDSAALISEAKYQYVVNCLDRDDQLSLDYLDLLVSENYKDTQSIYDEFYRWKVDIAVNKSKSGIHMDELYVSDEILPIYNFNFRTYGGHEDDEYEGTYEIIFSDGTKISDEYIGHDNDDYYSLIMSAAQNPLGLTTFNVYGESGELLATKTSNIR